MSFVERRLEPADSLVGQFQRGQGAGHLAAMELPASEVHAALDIFVLTDCVRGCDQQLDERERFIGEVATAVAWPVGPLTEHVASEVGADPGADGFAYDVLMQMARRGNEDARVAVVDSLGVITDWAYRLRDLFELGISTDGVRKVLASRADPPTEIAESLRTYPFKVVGSEEREFIASIPAMAELLPDSVPQPKQGRQRPDRRSKHMDRLVAMTTAELLDRVDPNLDGIATLRLALASPDHDLDIDVALRAAQTGTQRVRAAGMAALGAHQVDALLDIAPRLVSRGRSGWKQAPADYELQFGAFLALQSLRTERAVQMAVGWLDSPTALAQVALPILAARMPMNDVVAAVNQVEFDDAYLACDILDILIERDTGGAESMVRSLFNAAAYDMLRERCLRYLIAHDHRFVNGDGNVALWDASDLFVRRSAIRMLPLEVSEARLRELAEDEASGVSSDASERLNEWPESRSEE